MTGRERITRHRSRTFGVIASLMLALVLGSIMVHFLTTSDAIVIDQTFTGSDVLSLDLPVLADTLRVTGSVSGSADIYVQDGDTKTLIAHVDNEEFNDACDACALDLSSPDVDLIVDVDGELYLESLSVDGEPEDDTTPASVTPSFTGLSFADFHVAQANDSKPTISAPIFNTSDGSNKTNRNVTVYIQNASDADFDFIDHVLTYTLNGSPVEALVWYFSGNVTSANGTANGSVRDYSGNNVTGTLVNVSLLPPTNFSSLINNSFDELPLGNFTINATQNLTFNTSAGNWTFIVIEGNFTGNFTTQQSQKATIKIADFQVFGQLRRSIEYETEAGSTVEGVFEPNEPYKSRMRFGKMELSDLGGDPATNYAFLQLMRQEDSPRPPRVGGFFEGPFDPVLIDDAVQQESSDVSSEFSAGDENEGDSQYNQKITYYSPRFAGFSFASSYTPDYQVDRTGIVLQNPFASTFSRQFSWDMRPVAQASFSFYDADFANFGQSNDFTADVGINRLFFEKLSGVDHSGFSSFGGGVEGNVGADSEAQYYFPLRFQYGKNTFVSYIANQGTSGSDADDAYTGVGWRTEFLDGSFKDTFLISADASYDLTAKNNEDPDTRYIRTGSLAGKDNWNRYGFRPYDMTQLAHGKTDEEMEEAFLTRWYMKYAEGPFGFNGFAGLREMHIGEAAGAHLQNDASIESEENSVQVEQDSSGFTEFYGEWQMNRGWGLPLSGRYDAVKLIPSNPAEPEINVGFGRRGSGASVGAEYTRVSAGGFSQETNLNSRGPQPRQFGVSIQHAFSTNITLFINGTKNITLNVPFNYTSKNWTVKIGVFNKTNITPWQVFNNATNSTFNVTRVGFAIQNFKIFKRIPTLSQIKQNAQQRIRRWLLRNEQRLGFFGPLRPTLPNDATSSGQTYTVCDTPVTINGDGQTLCSPPITINADPGSNIINTPTTQGVSSLVIRLDNSTNLTGNVTGTKTMTFETDGVLAMSFTRDFSDHPLATPYQFDLSKITINRTQTVLIINISDLLDNGEKKTLYLNATNLAGVCVKDAEVQALTDVSAACDQPEEILFKGAECTENSVKNGITCAVAGGLFVISGLNNTGVAGVAAPTIDGVFINATSPNNLSSDNLTAVLQNASGAIAKYIYDWRLDNRLPRDESFTVVNTPFDGGSNNTNTKDYSAHGSHPFSVSIDFQAEPQFAPTAGRDGFGAYQFFRTNPNRAYLRIPDNVSQRIYTNDFSISVWFKTNSSNDLAIFEKQTSATNLVRVGMNTNLEPYLQLRLGTNIDEVVAPTNYSDGQWHHLAAVADRDRALELFVDGVLVANNTSPSIQNITASGLGTIGHAASIFRFFDGYLDDFVWYDVALAPEQVAVLAQNDTATIVSNTTVVRDRWEVCVTPNSGLADSNTSCSPTLAVEPFGNTAPELAAVQLASESSDNFSEEDLKATLGQITDVNFDTTKAVADWRESGNSITVLNLDMEADNASTAQDFSTYNNDGTVSGAQFNSTADFEGFGAYLFDGDDEINVAHDSSLNFGNATDFSIVVLFKSSSGRTIQTLIDKRDSTLPFKGYYLFLENGAPRIQLNDEFTNEFAFSGTYTDGLWHLLVATFDRSGNLTVYVDGVSLGTQDISFVSSSDGAQVFENTDISFIASTDNTQDLHVGGHSTTVSKNFIGTIASVQILDRLLTQDQVLLLNETPVTTIDNTLTSAGQTWQACYTPVDNFNGGLAGSTVCSQNITVQTDNAAPSIAQVKLNSTSSFNVSSGNLTRHVLGATDPENNSIKNITRWLVDGNDILSLYTPFEGGSSGTFTRAYVGNENGTVFGARLERFSGYDGFDSYHFDGDDFLFAGRSGAMLDEGHTVSIWVKADNFTRTGFADNVVYSRTFSTGSNEVTLRVSQTGVATLNRFSAGTSAFITSNQSMNVGQWHNIIIVTNISSGTQMYLDGVLVGSSTFVFSVSGTEDHWYVGADFDGGTTATEHWNGSIDDLQVYNRVLSGQQIQLVANNTLDTIVNAETNIFEMWQACVTPNDGYHDGAEVCSNLLSLVNAPNQNTPTIDAVIVNTSLGLNTTEETLQRFIINASDPDLDSVKNITDWKIKDKSDPVLHLTFEEEPADPFATNFSVKDYTSRSHAATAKGPRFTIESGYDNFSSLDFDGVDDIVEVDHHADLDISSDITIAFWINSPGVAGQTYVNKRDKTGSVSVNSYQVYEGQLRRPYFRYGSLTLTTSTLYPANQWTHITATYNANTTTAIIYYDGVQIVNNTNFIPTFASSPYPLLIGRPFNQSGIAFNGLMDDLYIFDRTLSPEEVEELVNGTFEDTLRPAVTVPNDIVKACVTPTDGRNVGVAVCSNTVALNFTPNTPPTATNARIFTTPETNLSKHNLSAELVGLSDTENDSVKNITKWLVANSPQEGWAKIYTPFEAGSNDTSTLDYSGNDFHGTVIGAEFKPNAGYDGFGAYEFNGLGDYIDLGNDSATELPGDRSIAAWIYPTQHNYAQSIIAKDEISVGVKGYILATGAHNVFPNSLIFETQGQASIQTNVINYSQWQHVAAIYNSTANQAKLYVNGNLVRTSDFFGASYIPTSAPVTIGRLPTSGSFTYWDGMLDDIYAFNYILTEDQIKLLAAGRGDTVLPFYTTEGQQWQACITPTDGRDIGAEYCSVNLTIATDQAPIVDSVVLTATSANVSLTDNLTATVNSRELNNQAVKDILDWRNNSQSMFVMNMPLEGVATSLADYTTYQNNASFASGAVFLDTGGHDGFGAYRFDGSNDYIQVPHDQSLSITGNMTVSAWIRINDFPAASQWDGIVAKGFNTESSTGNHNYLMTLDNGTFGSGMGLTFMFEDSAGSNFVVRYNGTINSSQWYMLTGVYDTGADELRLYIDGVLVATTPGITATQNTQTRTVTIGRSGDSGTLFYFDGRIDDVFVANRALSQQQITFLYNQQNTLSSEETVVGEQWQACAAGSDGEFVGSVTCSNILTIGTTPTGAINIEKTDESDPVLETGQVTYIITITGTGNGTAQSVNVTETYPAQTSFVSADPAPNVSNNVWYLGTLDPFEIKAITVTLDVNATNGTILTNNVNATFEGGTVTAQETTSVVDIFRFGITGNAGSVTTSGVGNLVVTIDGSSNLSGLFGNNHDMAFLDGSSLLMNFTHNFSASGIDLNEFSITKTAASIVVNVSGELLTSETKTLALNDTGQRAICVSDREINSDADITLLCEGVDETLFYREECEAITAKGNITCVISSGQFVLSGLANSGIEEADEQAGNRAPTISAIVLNSTSPVNLTSGDLIATIINATDQDGQSIKNLTTWRLNGREAMIFYVPFEESANVFNAADYAGFDNNATSLSGTPVYNATGGVDGRGAYEFGAGDQSVNLEATNFPEIGFGNYTVEAWIKTTDTKDYNAILGFGSNDPGWYVNNDRLRVFDFNSGGNKDSNTGLTITDGNWHHVAFVREGLGTGDLKFYLDGVAVGTHTHPDFIFSYTNVRIGWDGSAGDTNFEGTIDEVKLWNISLSGTQIQNQYQGLVTQMNSDMLSGGQQWQTCTVPHDGIDEGAQVCSNVHTVSPSQIGVVLTSPPAGNQFINLEATTPMRCSASGTNLENVTLFHDFDQPWGPQITWTGNGTINREFNFSSPNFLGSLKVVDTTITWNCLACTAFECQFASQNRTFGPWKLGDFINTTHNATVSTIDLVDDNGTLTSLTGTYTSRIFSPGLNVTLDRLSWDEVITGSSIRNPDFEENGQYGVCPPGWTCTGSAITGHISTFPGCAIPGNISGSFYAMGGCDAQTGSLTSSLFVLPDDIDHITWKRAGGADGPSSGFFVRLASNDTIICDGTHNSSSQFNTDTFFLARCDNLGPYAGQAAYAQIIDAATGSWGKTYVDDIRLEDASNNLVNLSTIGQLSFAVRTCDLSDCSDAPFSGNYGNSTLSLLSSGVGQYFQYQTLFTAFTDQVSPQLLTNSVNITYFEPVNHTIIGNASNVATVGVNNLIILRNGSTNINTPTQGVQLVEFYDGAQLLMNFTHDFTRTDINLSRFSIERTPTSLVVNTSDQLLSFERKTMVLPDDSFESLCVKDAEISSVSAMSADCTDAGEILFTAGECTSTTTNNSITCALAGGSFIISGLVHSGIAEGPDAKLVIYDSTDPEGGSLALIEGDTFNFTANYTNFGGDTPISGQCVINVEGFVSDANMTFNATGNNVYAYSTVLNVSGVHPWNVTCTNAIGFTNLTATDNVTVLTPGNRRPVISSVTLTSTSGSNLDDDNLTVSISVSDLDGDSVKNFTTWYVDGTNQLLLLVPMDNDNTTFNATDYAGFDNNATSLTGSPTWNATGGVDGRGAYEFGTADQAVNLATTNFPTIGTGNYTVEAWIKTSTTKSYNNIFAINNFDPGWYVDNNRMTVYDSGLITSPSSTISDGNWHYVVWVRDSTASGGLNFYLDGQLLGTATHGGSLPAVSTLRIGWDGFGGEDFEGTIDEFAFWQRALTPEQVLVKYQNRTDLIVSNETRVGDTWGACVVSNDGNLSSSQVCSNNITIVAVVAPNVTVTKTDTPDPVNNGSQLNYTITVNAFDNITNVTVVESFPIQVTFVSATTAPSVANTTWSLGNLTSGQSTQLNITVVVDANITNGTLLVNNANVSYQNSQLNTFSQIAQSQTLVNSPLIGPVPPVVTSAVLNSSAGTNTTSENLTVFATTTDVNGDNVTIAINYLLNGSLLFPSLFTFDGANSTFARNYGDESNASPTNGPVHNATNGFTGDGAYTFDGVDDYLSVAGGGGLNNQQLGTIMMRVRWDGTQDSGVSGANGAILSRQQNTVFSNHIIALSTTNPATGAIRWYPYSSSAAFTGSTAVGDGVWRHVAITYESGDHKLYLDGQLDGSSTTTGTISDNTGTPLSIGAWTGDGGSYCDCTISDVYISDKVLTQEQIQAYYENLTNTIVSEQTTTGDVWQAQVTPNDGTFDGSTFSTNTVTVLDAPAGPPNNVPSIGKVIVNSTFGTNLTTENLTAHAINVTDLDNDTVTLIYNWYVNDASITAVNMPLTGHGGDESTTAKDYSSNANNATVSGATWNQTGGFDGFGEYDFDGTNDRLIISDDNTLDFSGPFSVEIIARIDTTGTKTLFCKGSSNDHNYCLLLGDLAANDELELLVKRTALGSDATDVLTTTTANIVGGQTYHIVAVADGVNKSIYLNGQLLATNSALAPYGTNTDPLEIGSANGGSLFFDGGVYAFRVYNRSLSAEQIASLYQNRTDLVVSEETAVDDVWSVAVTPNDGKPNTDGSTVQSNNVTVLASVANVLPTIDAVILNASSSANLSTDNLTAHAINVTDADNDTVKLIFNWFVDGQSYAVLNMPFEGHDTNESTRAKDYTPFGNNGTVVGATWNQTGGYDGFGTYAFDGGLDSGDYIDVGSPSSLDDLVSSTIVVWARPTFVNTTGRIVQKQVVNAQGWQFTIDPRDAKRLIYQADFSTNDPTWVSDNNSIVLDAWQHLAVVYDNSDVSNDPVFYVNGQPMTTTEINAPVGTPVSDAASNLWIGARNNSGPDRGFNGSIASVHIYNRTLSPEQILALYNNRTDLIVSEETDVNETWYVDVTPNDGKPNTDGPSVISNNLTIVNVTAPAQNNSIIGNVSNVKTGGVTALNITIGGSSDLTGTFVGLHTLLFFDGPDLLMNFTHNFSINTINLSEVSINRSATSIVVNISDNLAAGETKTLHLQDGLASICVDDTEIASVDDITADCTGPGEILFTHQECVLFTTKSGVTCRLIGSEYVVSGLQNTGIVSGPNAQLQIYDSSDPEGGGEVIAAFQNVTFTANYTNLTSGAPIVGSCIVNIPAIVNGTNMTFNASGTNVYTHVDQFTSDGIFTWDVNCTNAQGFTNLSVADAITIIPSQPVPEFGTIALLLALGLVLGGFIIVRRRT